MFGIGPVEFIMLMVIAVIVFGPEKLPGAIKQAAQMIRQLRRMADNARNDLSDELGPEFRNLDLNDLRDPRRAVQKYVLDGIDEDDVRIDKDLDIRKDVDLRQDMDELDEKDSARPGKRRTKQLNGSREPGTESTSSGDDEQADAASGAVRRRTSESDDAQSENEDSGDDLATLTLTENERPPFDPEAT